MKIPFRERRKFTFGNNRITPETIRQLASVIEEEIRHIGSLQNELVLFSVDAADDSSYESRSTAIFDAGLFLDRKQIQKIVMRLTLTDGSKNIEVQISQTLKDNKENYVLVSGVDPTWVNGILSQFAEIIRLSDKQPEIVSWLGWIFFAFWVVFEIIIFNIMDKVPQGYHPILAATFVICMLGSPLYVIYLHEKMVAMWPAVELQTGPAYAQIPHQNRKKVRHIMAAIIFPILAALLYDLLKSGVMLGFTF